jgi:hypothetical protein
MGFGTDECEPEEPMKRLTQGLDCDAMAKLSGKEAPDL